MGLGLGAGPKGVGPRREREAWCGWNPKDLMAQEADLFYLTDLAEK